MKPSYGPGYTWTLGYDCLIDRWTSNYIGKYRVIVNGFTAHFMPSFTAVVDDFGNLVRVQS